MVVVRRAEAGDRRFLERVFAIAADWRAPTPRSVDEVLEHPELARYIEGWPARGDFGVVAEERTPVGAAWWRHFAATDPGYGFVDEFTPEISIGVVRQSRGVGTGTLLLRALIGAAQEHHLPALSLSVEIDNEARRLYHRLGFQEINVVAGSLTMVLDL